MTYQRSIALDLHSPLLPSQTDVHARSDITAAGMVSLVSFFTTFTSHAPLSSDYLVKPTQMHDCVGLYQHFNGVQRFPLDTDGFESAAFFAEDSSKCGERWQCCGDVPQSIVIGKKSNRWTDQKHTFPCSIRKKHFITRSKQRE